MQRCYGLPDDDSAELLTAGTGSSVRCNFSARARLRPVVKNNASMANIFNLSDTHLIQYSFKVLSSNYSFV